MNSVSRYDWGLFKLYTEERTRVLHVLGRDNVVEDGINKSVIDKFVIELSSSDSEVADDSDEETSGDDELMSHFLVLVLIEELLNFKVI